MSSLKKSISSLTNSFKSSKHGSDVGNSLVGFFKVAAVIILVILVVSLVLRLFSGSVKSIAATGVTTTKPVGLRYGGGALGYPGGALGYPGGALGYPGQMTPPPDAWWLPSRSSMWYWDWLYDPYYDYYWRTWYPEYHHHNHNYPHPTSAPTAAPTAAAPTVAAPTVAAPTVAAPTVAAPTVAAPTDAPTLASILPTFGGLNIIPTIPSEPLAIEPPMITFALPTFGGDGLPTMPTAAGLNMPTTLDVPDMIIQEPAIPTIGAFNMPSLTMPQPPMQPMMNQAPPMQPMMNQAPPMQPMMNQAPPMQPQNLGASVKESFANNLSCPLNMKPSWNIKEYVQDSKAKPIPSEYSTTNFEKANW